ncbi:SDR family NAD(P)-dependent oxidoreductase [Flavobacterium alkalisoli]|uniref:SDR family NAD(P)-dependent oxidoreductase n=1 Tax=Flavobacterium alkalisoli TaxID=2602769 RepID=A0A5B9FN80_9FLAO|nr:SDR family NAD(P)-dependent oxidoreductase [Flavobacterium alkalisoli]QEE48444.1 SDR family NAD(P)-dependent oxidoreductase [Flavobacterium alkalisoli]
MKTTGNTILITGGSAGIGFEIARQFVQQGNKVIITGRDAARLEKAKAELGNVTAIQFDVTSAADVDALTERIKAEFPELNILINNAGRALIHNLAESRSYDIAVDEMTTNYFSVLRLTDKLLPLLKEQNEAAVLNVSSVVAYVPTQHLPTYAASKAALHSYTTSLRLALTGTSVKVFELMPPLVNTELSKEIGGENGIAPSVVAEDVLDAIAGNRYEIRTGQTEDVYQLSLANPAEALKVMNTVA